MNRTSFLAAISGLLALSASADCTHMPPPELPRLFRKPRTEKYPGQFSAFRQGAWAGDGVKGPETRQMKAGVRRLAKCEKARASLLAKAGVA